MPGVVSFHFVSIGIEDKILGRKVIQPERFQDNLVVLKFGWERSEIQEWNSYCNSSNSKQKCQAHKLRRRLDVS